MSDDTAAQRARDALSPFDRERHDRAQAHLDRIKEPEERFEHTNAFEGNALHNEDYDRLTRAILKLSRGGWSIRQIARDLEMPDREVEQHLNRTNT